MWDMSGKWMWDIAQKNCEMWDVANASGDVGYGWHNS